MVVENPRTRFLITTVVMLAAVLQILDTTIVTVALPHMQGQLEANSEQISWVLTSYLISSGIFMPLTGFLTDRLGQKRYLLISIVGFVIASMLCGIATSLDEVVLFRLAQGIAGAGLVPSAQAILINIYPREKRGEAMAIFGVGAMVGPILGPTLGGYLTQVLNWRWTFFINLPVGIIALAGAWFFVPDTEVRDRRVDWLGFAFLAVAVSTMQIVLDRGQQDGWFSSHMIQILSVVSLFAYVCLIVRNLEKGPNAIFRMAVFRDRNFSVSVLILAAFMFSMYGALALQPLMLEHLYGYPTLTTGLVLAPRGVGSMLSMFLAGRLINRVGARPLIVVGFACVLLGTWVNTWYAPTIDPFWIIWPILLQGFGLGLVFVPLATVSFATLPQSWSAEAAGVRQLGRTIGASLGISISSAIMARESQTAWNQMGGHITPFSDALKHYLTPLHLTAHSPTAGAILGQMLDKQATLQGIIDAFAVMSLTVLLGAPLLLLLRKGAGQSETAENGNAERG